MLPYIGQEFVEALRFFATNRATTDRSRAASQQPPACKRQDRPTPFQHVMSRLRFLIVAVVTSKWMLYLILACF
jgi:hypothetical protein